MNNISLTIFFYAAIAVVILLSICVIYLVFVYRKLLEKYSDLTLNKDKSEIHQKIKIDTNKFINEKVDNAIDKATELAVNVITKNASEVAKSMREKTLEKLIEEEKGEEKAVALEYDRANAEIEIYKAQKFEEIKKKAAEILIKVTKDSLTKTITKDQQEELILKSLEDAKQSNLF